MNQQSGFQPQFSKFVGKNKVQLLLAEKIGISLTFIGVLLFYTLQIEYVLPIGGLFLALIYFFMAFAPIDIESMQDSKVMDSPGILLFVNKLAFLAMSISVMGIIFLLLDIQGSEITSYVGGTNLVIVLIYWLTSRKAINAQVLSKGFALRLLIMLIVLILILLMAFL